MVIQVKAERSLARKKREVIVGSGGMGAQMAATAEGQSLVW